MLDIYDGLVWIKFDMTFITTKGGNEHVVIEEKNGETHLLKVLEKNSIVEESVKIDLAPLRANGESYLVWLPVEY